MHEASAADGTPRSAKGAYIATTEQGYASKRMTSLRTSNPHGKVSRPREKADDECQHKRKRDDKTSDVASQYAQLPARRCRRRDNRRQGHDHRMLPKRIQDVSPTRERQQREHAERDDEHAVPGQVSTDETDRRSLWKEREQETLVPEVKPEQAQTSKRKDRLRYLADHRRASCARLAHPSHRTPPMTRHATRRSRSSEVSIPLFHDRSVPRRREVRPHIWRHRGPASIRE